MPPGRPRKPIEQRLAEGTYRADRHGPLADPDEPDAFAPPEKPADLDGEAGAMWDRLVILLAGVVRDRDGPALAELCWLWAELRRIKAAIAKVEPGAKGYQSLLVAAGIVTDKWNSLAARFGLTPADRAKLRAEQAGPQKPKVASRPADLDPPAPAAAKKKKGKR